MKEIKLQREMVTQVDDEDYDELIRYKWFANQCGHQFYASRHEPMVNWVQGKVIRMHQQIMTPPEGMRIDHIDMDGLNNQRKNLRICTHQQNLRNRESTKGSSSQYKGVCWDKERKKWMATIKKDIGQQLYLGRYDSEELAALAYNKKATELFGEFARPNVF